MDKDNQSMRLVDSADSHSATLFFGLLYVCIICKLYTQKGCRQRQQPHQQINTDTETRDQLALFPICTERQTRKWTTDTFNDTKEDKYNTRTIKGQRNKNTQHVGHEAAD